MIILSALLTICLSAESVSVKLIPETGSPPSARQKSGLTYDLDSRKLYIYGGRLANRYGELWDFDLLTQRWSEIHPASTLSPGPRSDSYIKYLPEQHKILLFGGDTLSGPTSDVWMYDIVNERVFYI